MKDAVGSKEKIRGIYEILSKLNCSFCGFGSCGQLARAVAEGRASPFGCRQNPWSGYRISEIVGMKVPAYSYEFQPALAPGPGVMLPPKALTEELRGLSRKAFLISSALASLLTAKRQLQPR